MSVVNINREMRFVSGIEVVFVEIFIVIIVNGKTEMVRNFSFDKFFYLCVYLMAMLYKQHITRLTNINRSSSFKF